MRRILQCIKHEVFDFKEKQFHDFFENMLRTQSTILSFILTTLFMLISTVLYSIRAATKIIYEEGHVFGSVQKMTLACH